MKAFLLKITLWTLPGALGCFGLWFGLFYLNPSRDTLGFNRIKPISCNSMVFGTSRSAQGVNPDILEKYAPETGEWLNYSFNIGASPWNDAYVDAILEKVNCSIETSQPSYFLIFADPWTLDEFCGAGEGSWFDQPWAKPCGTSIWDYGWHKSNPLDILGYGSGSDFLSVFASSVPRQFKDIFTNNPSSSKNSGVQINGWLPNKGELTLSEKENAIKGKVENYKSEKVIGKEWPFPDNSDALARLIDSLKKDVPQSKVILIRPPVADLMLELEQTWFPQTSMYLAALSEAKKIRFIDGNDLWTSKSTMDFNDAHHMSIEGANRFSQFLAETIQKAL